MSFPAIPITTLHGSSGPVHAVIYSASPSNYILTGSADRQIRLYNPSTSKLIQTYSAHGYEVLDLSVAPTNAAFVSCGGDRTVFLWDVATAKTLRRFGGNFGHTARINTVTFGANGDLIVSGSFDSSVRIWDTKSNSHKPIQVLGEAKDSIASVIVGGRDGAEIWVGSVDGRVRVYDIRMGKVDIDVIGAPVTSIANTRDWNAVLAGCLDGVLRLIDRSTGNLLKAYKGHQNGEFRIRSVFGGRDRWVLCGSEETDGEVVVWDTMSGEVVERIKVPKHENVRKIVSSDGTEKTRKNVISSVAWKDDGKGDQWCCAGTDGIVTVFGNSAQYAYG